MLVKYIYKYIQLQIHRLAFVCWQPVSCDESESSPTVIKGHASLLNEIFRLRSSPFFFLLLNSKCWMKGPFGHYCPRFCPVLFFVQKLSAVITIHRLQFVNKNSHRLPTGQRHAPSAVNYSEYSAYSA